MTTFERTGQVAFHEVADVFPLMEGEEFEDFKADIRSNGLLTPILLADDKIADGRNRYRACIETDTEPRFDRWDGKGDLLTRVVSLNLHRRHLNAGQRAMVAAKLKPRFEAEAKERMATSTGGATPQPVANLPQAANGKSRDEAAKLLNVSPRLVETASKVMKEAIPELVKAVEDGAVKVSAAVEVAALPRAEQAALVAEGPAAVKAKAGDIREGKKHQSPDLSQEPVAANSQPSIYTLQPTPVTSPEKAAEAWTKIILQYCSLKTDFERRGGIETLAARWPKDRIILQEEACRDISAQFTIYAEQLRRLLS